jgi:F0F1-type ATP synthase gamma subunit
LTQDPIVTSVTGDAFMAEQAVKEETEFIKSEYLFEPTVEDIAKIFEGEILASVFQQTLHESQLAKYASRMIALDRSVDNIERRLSGVRGEEVRIRHKLQNRKQLSTISGISLWTNA